jgi:hypothetical protein
MRLQTPEILNFNLFFNSHQEFGGSAGGGR